MNTKTLDKLGNEAGVIAASDYQKQIDMERRASACISELEAICETTGGAINPLEAVAASILGRKGAAKGGRASKRKITPEQQKAMQDARKMKRKDG